MADDGRGSALTLRRVRYLMSRNTSWPAGFRDPAARQHRVVMYAFRAERIPANPLSGTRDGIFRYRYMALVGTGTVTQRQSALPVFAVYQSGRAARTHAFLGNDWRRISIRSPSRLKADGGEINTYSVEKRCQPRSSDVVWALTLPSHWCATRIAPLIYRSD